MRIAMLSPPSFPVGPGATASSAVLVGRLTRGLIARGHQVTLFATGDSVSPAELVSICSRASTDLQELTSSQWDGLHAVEAFRRARDFDLIHSHMDASILPLSELVDAPLVATIHRIHSPSESSLLSRFAGRVAFVANGDAEKIQGMRYAGVVSPEDPAEGYERIYRKVLDRRENHRPWGYYEILEDRPEHKVKRIVVFPGQRLSLQMHHRRAEHWLVIGGEGLVTRDDDEILVPSGEAIDIPRGARHRVRNPGEEPLVFIEVQTGEYFGEDDIIRFEDDYGRTD